MSVDTQLVFIPIGLTSLDRTKTAYHSSQPQSRF